MREERAPTGWSRIPLKRVVRIPTGLVDPAHPAYRELRLVAPNHVESGTGRLLGWESAYDQGAASGKFLVEDGELIYSKIRPALNKVCIAPERCLCSADMYPLRPVPTRLVPAYLMYQILSMPFVQRAIDDSMRVAMPKVNRERLGEFLLTLPPLPTQRAIASYLDRETARIDTLIERKERLLELLEEKRTALITQAVTKGLDPTVPMKDSGVEWLGEVPAHWEVVEFRRVLRRIEQGWSPGGEDRVLDPGEWGVVKSGCVNGGRFDESQYKALSPATQVRPELRINEGDLLMSRASGSPKLVGSVAVVGAPTKDLLLSDKIYRIHLQVTAEAHFIALFLRSSVSRRQIEASISGAEGLANNITQTFVRAIVVALPPPGEQRLIAGRLRRAGAALDALSSRITHAIALLKEYRSALISAAVTGQIEVPELPDSAA